MFFLAIFAIITIPSDHNAAGGSWDCKTIMERIVLPKTRVLMDKSGSVSVALHLGAQFEAQALMLKRFVTSGAISSKALPGLAAMSDNGWQRLFAWWPQ